ncbi:MAG: hypothetical protein Q9171_004601 [Xanthocarpia ochracea]
MASSGDHPPPNDFEPQETSSSMHPTANPDELKIKGLGRMNHARHNDLPRALQVGHEPSEDQMDDRPAALKLSSDQLTPKSSSESFRHGQLSTAAESAASNSQSNNPYMRVRSDFSQGVSANDGNPAAVWADEPLRTDKSFLEYHSTAPAVADPLFSSQPADVPKAPFTARWTGFKQSPEEQVLTSATATNGHTSEVLDPTSEWDREMNDQVSKPRHHFPVREVSYNNELQKLEAQPFSSIAGEPQHLMANEKLLPSLPHEPAWAPRDEKPPDLPSRHSFETSRIPPMHSPALHDPQDKISEQAPHPPPTSDQEQAKANQQRNQTYQIRLVNWFDSSSPVNPRTSPIMVQNANGPCPLLALVNALILSTPAGLTTALVETLRVREQVSLGLLLDAVIDELMSSRRGGAAQRLPDVSELYAFLVNLHTGMNVNPRFVEPIAAPTQLLDDPVDAPSATVDIRKVGGFEDSPAMRLYATFAVPLIHGWLPRRNHPVCASLERSAKTYEDAQSLLFVEEDLENKLQAQGLTAEEQRLLEDVSSIKYFLTSSPTQLTDYGLDTITETLRPGAIAILFRNDHFSTLLKESRSGRIFTLVTDLGYAGHDEIVWESLVDISGEGSEFFSGDFRPVGNNFGNSNRRSAGPPNASEDAGWTTVSKSGGRRNSRPSGSQRSAPNPTEPASVTNAFSQLSVTPSNTEQEDHDLALAMQLQEEEEDQERQDAAARRRREDELSRAYLNSTGRQSQRGGRPQVPARGGGARQAPRRKQMDDDGDLPPPTYEQAAKGPAYNPPTSESPHTGASSRPKTNANAIQGNRPTRQTSAYSQTQSANATFANASRPTPPSRRPTRPEKDKECVVM